MCAVVGAVCRSRATSPFCLTASPSAIHLQPPCPQRRFAGGSRRGYPTAGGPGCRRAAVVRGIQRPGRAVRGGEHFRHRRQRFTASFTIDDGPRQTGPPRGVGPTYCRTGRVDLVPVPSPPGTRPRSWARPTNSHHRHLRGHRQPPTGVRMRASRRGVSGPSARAPPLEAGWSDPGTYHRGSGTIVSGKVQSPGEPNVSLAAYPCGVVDRVVQAQHASTMSTTSRQLAAPHLTVNQTSTVVGATAPPLGRTSTRTTHRGIVVPPPS